ncbi:MAG: pseudouridine synthase [Methylobacterium mesophilicum]|nr:pseudouridine synthase [Methylobacterium mesophilicum]
MDDKPKRPRRDERTSGKGGRGEAPRTRARAFDKAEGDSFEGERIAKRLARVGVASRREAEGLIADGRIRVNGEVLTSPARNVMPEDLIELDGKPLPSPERTRLFLFHKPAGVVTTNRDPEGRKTVFDVLPEGLPRLMTVGRLDINTEGLLLLTNDGGLSRVLELPQTGWLRRYRVRVHGEVDEAKLASLKDGIAVDGVFYGAIEAELERTQGSNAWISVGLREGKNREVKNVMGALGLEVNRLIRVSFGPFQLGELEEGHVLEIKGRTLRDQLGDRLIEESGADFESDIQKPFSNRPTQRENDRQEPREARARMEEGEGGLIKRRRMREDSRDNALGRLSTCPERRFEKSDRPRGERPERPRSERREENPGRPEEKARTANVWMAPGARPQGADKPKPERAPREDRPRRESGGERFQRRDTRGERPEGGESRPRRPYAPREGGEDRPFRKPRAEGERAERPFRKSGEGKPFRERSEGDRPFRREDGERPRKPFEGGDRPRYDKPRGERPAREDGEKRSFRPRGEGGEQRAERPFRERREGDRPFGNKPRGERPFGARSGNDRPRGDRPHGERPAGNKFGGKGGKPGGFKPGGSRPGGGGFKGKPRGPRS